METVKFVAHHGIYDDQSDKRFLLYQVEGHPNGEHIVGYTEIRLSASARGYRSTLGWSMTQSHVPSGCRRATSAVAPPSNRVEVNARSPLRRAGRCSPLKRGLVAMSSSYA